MAAGKINLQKASGGVTSITGVDGTGNTELVLPESGTVVSIDGSVTDNAIARYDGTTGKLQNSGVVIDDSGHLIVSSGVTLGTSVGVYNAANTLDDYEEGSWTPSGIVTYGTVTFTPNSSSGRYIKIGNQVTCWFQLEVTTTSVNGNFGITGLPFSAANNSFPQNGGVCRQNTTGGQTFFIESISGSSVTVIRRYDNGGIGVGHLLFQGQFSYSIEQ